MNNNIIITETYTNLRALARKSLSGKWFSICVGVIIFVILSSSLPAFLSEVIPAFKNSFYIDPYTYFEYSTFPSLYALAIDGPFFLGISMFILNFVRMGKVSYDLIFNGFELFFKAFLLNLLIAIFVSLWTFLFFIPGIIAILRYSQAFYILADNPHLSPLECIRQSKLMMRGNKAYYFGLKLSFIGWLLVAAICVALTSKIFENVVPVDGAIYWLFFTVTAIPIYIVFTYSMVTSVIFYELASGHLRPLEKPTYANIYGNINNNRTYDNTYNMNSQNGTHNYNRQESYYNQQHEQNGENYQSIPKTENESSNVNMEAGEGVVNQEKDNLNE